MGSSQHQGSFSWMNSLRRRKPRCKPLRPSAIPWRVDQLRDCASGPRHTRRSWVVVLRVPGVAVAGVAPVARDDRCSGPGNRCGDRPGNPGGRGAGTEIEVDIAGHRARAGRVGRVHVVAANAVARVVVALQPPVRVHPAVQAVDGESAGATVARELWRCLCPLPASSASRPGVSRRPPRNSRVESPVFSRKLASMVANSASMPRQPVLTTPQKALVDVDLQVCPLLQEIGELLSGGVQAHLLNPRRHLNQNILRCRSASSSSRRGIDATRDCPLLGRRLQLRRIALILLPSRRKL